MYTIYSLGDTWYLGKVMDAIAMVSGSDSSFVGASAIAAMVGVFMIMFQALLKGGQALSLQIFLVCYIFYMGCFHTTVDVAIEGVYSDQDVVQKDNIPAGPAILGSIISSVGHGLTEKMEQAFAAIDNPVILGANGGYLNSLYTINNLARLSESDKALHDLEGLGNPYLGENIRRYIAECTTKAVYVGKRYGGTTTSEMQTTTTDGLKHIIFNSEFYGTLYRDNNGNEQTLSCKEAGEKNALDFQSAVTALTSDTHKICEYANIMGFEKDMASCNAGDYLNNVSSAWEHLRQSHYTMQSLMAAGIARNLTHEGLAMGYSTYGNDLSATMIYQAIQQRNVQWTAEQSMFLNSVKPIMSFIEGFFYAISPFAGIMVWLGMMGLNIFFKYLIMLIWIQLWLPILSIANLFITTSASRALNALPKNSNGMSLQEYEELVSICQDRIAVGGMMMAATPVLSLMVITGSVYAFTQLTSRMQGADHINEKIVAPDAMQPSAYMATQATFNADSYKATRNGYKGISFNTQDIMQTQLSATKSSMESNQQALTTAMNEGLQKLYGHNTTAGLQSAYNELLSHSDNQIISDTENKVKSWLKNHNFAVNDANTSAIMFGLTGNKRALGQNLELAKNKDGKDIVNSTENGASAGGSAGVNAGNNRSITVSDAVQEMTQDGKTFSKGEVSSFTDSVSSQLSDTLSESDTVGENASIARTINTARANLKTSQEQYSAAVTASQSLGVGTNIEDNDLIANIGGADKAQKYIDNIVRNLSDADKKLFKHTFDSFLRDTSNDTGTNDYQIKELRTLYTMMGNGGDNETQRVISSGFTDMLRAGGYMSGRASQIPDQTNNLRQPEDITGPSQKEIDLTRGEINQRKVMTEDAAQGDPRSKKLVDEGRVNVHQNAGDTSVKTKAQAQANADRADAMNNKYSQFNIGKSGSNIFGGTASRVLRFDSYVDIMKDSAEIYDFDQDRRNNAREAASNKEAQRYLNTIVQSTKGSAVGDYARAFMECDKLLAEIRFDTFSGNDLNMIKHREDFDIARQKLADTGFKVVQELKKSGVNISGNGVEYLTNMNTYLLESLASKKEEKVIDLFRTLDSSIK